MMLREVYNRNATAGLIYVRSFTTTLALGTRAYKPKVGERVPNARHPSYITS